MDAFKISLLLDIETIASLIPINLHLQQLGSRSQLRAHSLPPNHILQSLMNRNLYSSSCQHALSLSFLTRCQQELIKGHIIDMNNCFNEVFPSFDSFNPEFSPSNRIIDTFSNHFSFHLFNKCISQNIKSHIQQLYKLAFKSSDSPSFVLIVTDANIKNNIATSISHIHICNKSIMKTLHHTLNIMSTEAELFTIRCSINQVANNNNISKIIVVMDSIHVAKKNFGSSNHFFQKYSVSILKDL